MGLIRESRSFTSERDVFVHFRKRHRKSEKAQSKTESQLSNLVLKLSKETIFLLSLRDISWVKTRSNSVFKGIR